jgi:hypothetical protein
MDVERTLVEETTDKPNSESQKLSSNKSGRPPPIVLTSTTHLMQLQRNTKDIVTGNTEFRDTRSGTRIVTKVMADFSVIKKYVEKTTPQPLLFYLFPQIRKET